MSNVFSEKVATMTGSEVSSTKDAKDTKARSTSIEVLKMDMKAQYTDVRIHHRLNAEGQPDFKPSASGKCLMFGGRTLNTDIDGAPFFISASIGLRNKK
jgi:hypothetical protein